MKTGMRMNDGMRDFLTPLRGHQGRARACAPIQITGYDRNGKVVKHVTSDDKGDVENPDGNPDGGGDTPSGGGSGDESMT